MGSFGAAAARNLGAIEKCILVFKDNREALEAPPQEEDAAAAGAPRIPKARNASMKTDWAGALLSGSGIGDQLSKAIGAGQTEHAFDDNDRVFRLQFNPSSLSISGDAPDPTLRAQFSKSSKASASTDEVQVVYSVSFQVIFDDCDPNDAFLENKLLGSYSNPVSMGMGVANRLKEKNGHSIRPQMEAFIAVARSAPHVLNEVTLYWGDMSYSGLMNGCTCSYTMFNPAGEPIRGTADINLLMFNTEHNADDYRTLQRAYDDVFGQNANGDGAFDKFKKKSSNLLNFG